MRVLIAEDDTTSRRVLETVLRKWGYEVISVADGEAAWEALRCGDAPRLAILDWMMPGLEGTEVCHRIRQQRGGDATYIILLTVMGHKEDIVAGLDAGANDYITKPFDKDELRARVQVGRRVLELQSALAERVTALEEALAHVRTLQGVLPICMHCHKIRTDQESWERIETYIQAHSDAEFSHGCCPDCIEKHYPKLRTPTTTRGHDSP